MPKGAGRWAGEVCILIESGPMAYTVPADGPAALAQLRLVGDGAVLGERGSTGPKERLVLALLEDTLRRRGPR